MLDGISSITTTQLSVQRSVTQIAARWKCVANVTWTHNGGPARHTHFIKRGDELFSRFEDAVQAGLEAAKNWIDGRLTTPSPQPT